MADRYQEDFSKYSREELEVELDKCYTLLTQLGAVYYSLEVMCSTDNKELPTKQLIPVVLLKEAHEILETHCNKAYSIEDGQLVSLDVIEGNNSV